ncbi:MAG: cytochrome c, class I [Gammaproteobacteria bacterium]
MIRNSCLPALLLTCLLFSLNVYGQGFDAQRARYNYMMFCQGCHLPGGEGVQGRVPEIKGFIGRFLEVEGGREFLVRVPGAANAAIGDAELAELLNWIIITLGGASAPENFEPYTAREVGRLRKDPLLNVNDHRDALIEKIKHELTH